MNSTTARSQNTRDEDQRATLAAEDGALVWRMRSTDDRFTGTFSDDGNTITGRWESAAEDSSWRPWMEVTLTRRAS